MTARVFVFVLAGLAMADTSLAQQRERIGPWVADVRVASVGLPAEPGWTPAVPTGTITPSRTLGLDLGAHVYVLRRRSIAVGVGATWITARGTSAPPDVDGSTPPTTPTRPEVSTRLSSLAPQLSLNFGHSLGYSYVSAGLGRTRIESEATLTGTTFTPRDSDWVKTLNYGGGARWFLNDRVGVGFDVRWHKLSLVAATPTSPGAPRASLLVAGVGVVVK